MRFASLPFILLSVRASAGATLTLLDSKIDAHGGSSVRAVDITSDGINVVSGGEDGTLFSWLIGDTSLSVQRYRQLEHIVDDLETSSPGVIPSDLVLTGEGGLNGGHCVAMSESFVEDGVTKILLAGSDKGAIEIYKYSIASGAVEQGTHINGEGNRIDEIKWLHGNDRIARSMRGKIEVWSYPGAQLLQTLSHDGVLEHSMDVKGDLIVSGTGKGRIKLWDLEEQEPLLADISSGGAVFCIAFSPSGTMIVAGKRTSITVYRWDGNTLEELVTNTGAHTDRINSVAFSPIDEQVVVSGSRDGTIKLWNLDVSETNGPPLVTTTTTTDSQRCMPYNQCTSHADCCGNYKCRGSWGDGKRCR